MSLRLVHLDRVAPQPWRNGGGSTRELLAWPSPVDWQLRISLADIAQDGPFSAFPGVDRWFAVVQGAGVVLHFAQGRQVLGPDSGPLHFDGALTPGCSLQGGATRDLNLMARRDAGRASMARVQADAEWVCAAPLRAVYSAEAAVLQIDDADAARLPAGTLAFSDHAARQRWRLVADSASPRAWWMDFTPGCPH